MAITICDSCELRRICLDKNKFYPVVKCQNYHEGEEIMVEQTNEEWLRTATTEQLAELIALICGSNILLVWRIIYHCADSDVDAVKMWLKQPHT